MLTRIDHVGLAVRDLDEAIAFYARTFDVQVVHEEVMLDVGGAGARIQLLAPLRPDSPIGKFLERSGEGIQQVAYGVDDIDAVSAELRARGVRLLYDEPRRGTAGSRVNFVHPKDAMGVLVELVEAAPDH
jgi:methylmalonyl-CoA/ethylmalonyl-CoA epimerase